MYMQIYTHMQNLMYPFPQIHPKWHIHQKFTKLKHKEMELGQTLVKEIDWIWSAQWGLQCNVTV